MAGAGTVAGTVADGGNGGGRAAYSRGAPAKPAGGPAFNQLETMPGERSRSLERRYHRALRWGVVLSLVAHAALFLVFDHTSLPPSPFAAAGERRGDLQAALGGGMEAVEMESPPEAAVAPEEPVPEEDAEEVEIEPPDPQVDDMGLPDVALADRLSLPGATGPLEIPGLADGMGEGDGGTEAEGRFRVMPPRPRGMILPPSDRPEKVRGQEVDVWVYVSAAGQVVPDSTRLDPPTGDRRFDRRLRDHAAGWVFEAAHRDGRAVGEWFRYTIIM